KPRDEATHALGCSLGALKDRLQRGKEMLHKRLSRRGVTLSAALTASLFAETLAPVALSADLIASTVRASTLPARQIEVPIAMLASAGLKTGAGRIKLAVGMMAATVMIGFAASLANFVSAAPVAREKPKEVSTEPVLPDEPRVATGKRL